MNRYTNKQRKDVRSIRSTNKFERLDADIGSQYVDDDPVIGGPSEAGGSRMFRNTVGNVIRNAAGGVMHGGQARKFQRGNRRDQQAMGGAGGLTKSKEMVSRIKIRFGRKFGIQWVLRQLSQQVEDLKPILPAVVDNDVIFFLRNEDTADAVVGCSRRITNRETGDRMVIFGEKTVAPWQKLDKREVDVINEVVDSRYDHESRVLNLAEFARDQRFASQGLTCLLTMNNVMLSVMDRIDEKYGHVTALSLQGNRLRQLDCCAMLCYITKFVKVLDLRDNQISSEKELEKLKGLPVETIFFEGNPFSENASPSAYLSAIHAVFPRVSMLDGTPVQPSSVMPLAEECKEPPIKGSFLPESLRPIIDAFLVEFFKLYDDPNCEQSRKKLMPAYEEINSTFTLCISNLPDAEKEKLEPRSSDLYPTYLRASHNIVNESKWARSRKARVHRGAMDIAVALSKLPKTNHYTESFMLDVSLVTDKLLMFSIQGLFEDGDLAKKNELPVLNFFQRQFLVAPRGEGQLVVVSDQLFISYNSAARVARYRQLMNKANRNTASQNATPAVSVTDVTAALQNQNVLQPGQINDELKRQMILEFSRESGMKPEWSEKCLVDSDWNYQEAGRAFLAHRASIPPDAFV